MFAFNQRKASQGHLQLRYELLSNGDQWVYASKYITLHCAEDERERHIATGRAAVARKMREKRRIATGRAAVEAMSFPWLTALISSEVFSGSEITASVLSRSDAFLFRFA